MVLWQGLTEGGTAVPVQVTEAGEVVAATNIPVPGPEGPPGPEGQPGKDGPPGKDGDQWVEVNSRLIKTTNNVDVLIGAGQYKMNGEITLDNVNLGPQRVFRDWTNPVGLAVGKSDDQSWPVVGDEAGFIVAFSKQFANTPEEYTRTQLNITIDSRRDRSEQCIQVRASTDPNTAKFAVYSDGACYSEVGFTSPPTSNSLSRTFLLGEDETPAISINAELEALTTKVLELEQALSKLTKD